MVAVSIFSIVVMVAIGATLSIVGANKKAQALSSVINNLNFAVESMVRDLRTGYNYSCGPSLGFTCSPSSPTSVITFYSEQYAGNVTYSFSNGHIFKTRNSGTQFQITADEVKINHLNFIVTKSSSPGVSQPKILLVIDGEAKSGLSVSQFKIQSLLSQRKIDL